MLMSVQCIMFRDGCEVCVGDIQIGGKYFNILYHTHTHAHTHIHTYTHTHTHNTILYYYVLQNYTAAATPNTFTLITLSDFIEVEVK